MNEIPLKGMSPLPKEYAAANLKSQIQNMNLFSSIGLTVHYFCVFLQVFRKQFPASIMNDMSLFPEGTETSATLTEDFYRNTVFTKVDFSSQPLNDKEFFKCRFVQCSFYKAKLSSCEFENCSFEKCDVSLWKVSGNKFIDVEFRDSKIVGVDWAGLRSPSRFNFYDCILNNNIFLKLNLNGIEIINCQVRESDFSESNLTKAVLTQCDFHATRFQMTNLTQADLSDSLNYTINPNSAKLKKTIFTMPGAMSLLNSFDIIIK